MLRALQEASFFDARLRLGWRGRVFTLRRPTLTRIQVGLTNAVIVSGAVPARLEADFRKTVSLQGGTPFRRLPAETLAPPLLGASDVEPNTLSESLGWPIIDPPILPDGAISRRLIETKVRGDGYQPSSLWDWSIGRFRVATDSSGPVRLTRMVHPGQRDHDVYRVEGRIVRSFHSRHAAILDAHMQAGRPLFRYEHGNVDRLAGEGSLPLEVAAALRVRSLANGGGTLNGWRYQMSQENAIWLARLLPGVIEGIQEDGAGDMAMSCRRGRGARRYLWSDGVIAA